jgi:RsiW-degrading membrane proteinase PrsW (M82 family)
MAIEQLKDPKTLILSFVGGILPALIWLWFWLKEDKENPEPKGLLFLTFVLGMIAVILILPFEKIASGLMTSKVNLTLTLATLEESIKYLAALAIALRSKYVDEPADFAIYMITAALGFAAFENFLFLIQPVSLNDNVVSILTGNLRFLGAILLHTTASAIVGILLGLAYFKTRSIKRFYLVIGLITAIALHTIFNFYIMRGEGGNFMQIFGFLWVATIMILLIFEKLRRMSPNWKPGEALAAAPNPTLAVK